MLFLSPVKSSVLLETVVHYRLCSYILGVSVFKYTSACTVIWDIPCSPTPVSPTLDQKVVFRLLVKISFM